MIKLPLSYTVCTVVGKKKKGNTPCKLRVIILFRMGAPSLPEAVAEDVYGGTEIGTRVSFPTTHCMWRIAVLCRPFKLSEAQFNECSFRCGRVLHENIEVLQKLLQ